MQNYNATWFFDKQGNIRTLATVPEFANGKPAPPVKTYTGGLGKDVGHNNPAKCSNKNK